MICDLRGFAVFKSDVWMQGTPGLTGKTMNEEDPK